MRRINLLNVVALLGLIFSTTAGAGSLFWGLPGDWTETDAWGYGIPTSAAAGDYAYCYTNTSAAPITVPAGQSVSIDWMHFDYYGADHGMVINGTASFGNGAGYDGIYLGNYSTNVGGYALIQVNAGGELHSTKIATYGTGGDWNIVLNGGSLTLEAVEGTPKFTIKFAADNLDSNLVVPPGVFNSLVSNLCRKYSC